MGREGQLQRKETKTDADPRSLQDIPRCDAKKLKLRVPNPEALGVPVATQRN